MNYLVSGNAERLIYISSGQLLQRDAFLHPRRVLDTFVLIVCVKGTLYVGQSGREYAVSGGQYVILFAAEEHYGVRPSEGELSYYWCHFRPAGKYHIAGEDELARLFDSGEAYAASAAGGNFDFSQQAEQGRPFVTQTGMMGMERRAVEKLRMSQQRRYSSCYILPEYGSMRADGRVLLIFRQLLDIARKDYYSPKLPDYALSLLAMELAQEFVEARFRESGRGDNPRMDKIIEWLRVNYNLRLSMKAMTRYFDYNADYLSTAFRRYTGVPLMKYITMVRIENAKKLLLNSSDGIKEIAGKVGFDDEKTFMKRFKQLENITPSTYRNAFNHTKVVK